VLASLKLVFPTGEPYGRENRQLVCGPSRYRDHPASSEYDVARKVYNGMIDCRPDAILRCANVADVRAAVNFAGEEGLTVAVRCGGHNSAGLDVEQITRSCGFGDEERMRATFKRHLAISPRDYRRRFSILSSTNAMRQK